uniref:Acetyltransferase n=1 Tax=Ascaris lumbricoides TaxID=6252 RepID=A0A0M3I3P3_ASCLU
MSMQRVIPNDFISSPLAMPERLFIVGGSTWNSCLKMHWKIRDRTGTNFMTL